MKQGGKNGKNIYLFIHYSQANINVFHLIYYRLMEFICISNTNQLFPPPPPLIIRHFSSPLYNHWLHIKLFELNVMRNCSMNLILQIKENFFFKFIQFILLFFAAFVHFYFDFKVIMYEWTLILFTNVLMNDRLSSAINKLIWGFDNNVNSLPVFSHYKHDNI